MADEKIHYRPCFRNGNVKCLNGNAHARQTYNIEKVTCKECLKNETEGFWNKFFSKTPNCANCPPQIRDNCKR